MNVAMRCLSWAHLKLAKKLPDVDTEKIVCINIQLDLICTVEVNLNGIHSETLGNSGLPFYLVPSQTVA